MALACDLTFCVSRGVCCVLYLSRTGQYDALFFLCVLCRVLCRSGKYDDTKKTVSHIRSVTMIVTAAPRLLLISSWMSDSL